MPVDFFASHPHYIDHAAPVFRALGETAGAFRVPDHLTRYLERYGIENTPTDPGNPLVFLSYGELSRLPRNAGLIFLAHGAEQPYDGKAHLPRIPSLKLVLTNPTSAPLLKRGNQQAEVVSVGCPKLDRYHGREFPRHDPPVICFSHHWNQRSKPETASGWEWSREAIEQFAKSTDYTVVIHKHPADRRDIEGWAKRIGCEFISEFSDVLETADLYVCDNSSTLYEFAATDRPVVCLSPPFYRRDRHHGLRFWDAMPGIDCGVIAHLPAVIDEALADSDHRKAQRKAAVHAAYGEVDGKATERAADAIRAWYARQDSKETT